jgi:hypothetical protein
MRIDVGEMPNLHHYGAGTKPAQLCYNTKILSTKHTIGFQLRLNPLEESNAEFDRITVERALLCAARLVTTCQTAARASFARHQSTPIHWSLLITPKT